MVEFFFRGFSQNVKKFVLDANIPQLQLIGDYKINGQILVLPIQGEGYSNLTLGKYVFINLWHFSKANQEWFSAWAPLNILIGYANKHTESESYFQVSLQNTVITVEEGQFSHTFFRLADSGHVFTLFCGFTENFNLVDFHRSLSGVAEGSNYYKWLERPGIWSRFLIECFNGVTCVILKISELWSLRNNNQSRTVSGHGGGFLKFTALCKLTTSTKRQSPRKNVSFEENYRLSQ